MTSGLNERRAAVNGTQAVGSEPPVLAGPFDVRGRGVGKLLNTAAMEP